MPQLNLRPYPLVAPPRGQKQQCEICSEMFNIGTREHVCKRCFRSVCDSCSPYKVRSYRSDAQHRLHRMCKVCHKESAVLNRYAEDHKIGWGEDSDMSRMWLKQLGHQVNRNSARTSYRASVRKTNTQEEFQTTLVDLWSSFNFSFREFVGLSIDRSRAMRGLSTGKEGSSASKAAEQKVNKQILQQILGCLTEIYGSIQTPLAPEDIIYILIFFMAHSSPYNAVIFTKSIVQWLSFQKSTVEGIVFFLEQMGCSDIECYKIENFLEDNLDHMIHTATVNYFTAEISIEIVSSLISKKKFQELEKGIAYVISLRKNFICKNSQRADLIELDILKNTQGLGERYRKQIKDIESSENHETSRNQSSKLYSDTASSILRSEKYEELIRKNEELKIKNKNQEEEIIRLKTENNKLVETMKKMEEMAEEKDQWSKVRKKSIMLQHEGNDKLKRNNTPKALNVPRNSRVSHGTESDELLGMFNESKVQLIQRSSQESYESYWEEQEISNESDEMNISIPFDSVLERKSQHHQQGETFKKTKKTRMVKKHRCKSRQKIKNNNNNNCNNNRFTSMSEKFINTKQTKKQVKPENEIKSYDCDKYEEIIYRKNQEIKELKRLLQIAKCNAEMAEQEVLEKEIEEIRRERDELKQELQKMRELNKDLLLKMQQLSNMLMDKEEEQVQQSKKSLEELTKIYEEKSHEHGDDCKIF